ncbi:TRAP transporter large permease subunit [Ammoniphilus sp. CFH 90114]|uniref:TRAP transporter large permease subunit n=1 Tax=Ammoniphilus sp. CFH 90114 TaxID=2493665 RepID=UPI00100F9C54|nr:TRAP transporter large permease subunit [Ammoniphilus sp. CFH 90114]RXT06508.1 TRAP transporter large permease subunit [Ammoniphilus sp. CFH 90114]
MLTIIIPMLILFAIVLIPKIPKIGGEIRIGLIAAGLVAAILGGLGPIEILKATIDGIDRLAWVIMLSIFGSIYAETQVKLGTMDTTLLSLRSVFGKSSNGLIAAIILTLVLAGSLLGDAIAAATVIGFLVINSLHELKVKPEQIGMIILVGASLGSIMPPISQGIFLSASLINTDPGPVLQVAYFTVGLGVIFAIVESFRFVKGKKLPAELLPDKTFLQIMKQKWYTLVPLLVLVFIIVANSGFKYDIFSEWPFFAIIVDTLKDIPILKGLTFKVVMAILVATFVSYLFLVFRKDTQGVFTGGLGKVKQTVQIQLSAGFMIGIFYATGAIDIVKTYAEGLHGTTLKIGGGLATALIGMLTGSQTAAQTTIVTFFGPILENLGVNPVNIAIGASHIAAAGQNMPPVGLTAFVVCGLIGGILSTKVDPVKVMFLALPNSVYFLIAGFIALFI